MVDKIKYLIEIIISGISILAGVGIFVLLCGMNNIDGNIQWDIFVLWIFCFIWLGIVSYFYRLKDKRNKRQRRYHNCKYDNVLLERQLNDSRNEYKKNIKDYTHGKIYNTDKMN